MVYGSRSGKSGPFFKRTYQIREHKMKNILLIILVLTVCTVHSQRKPKIKGNKNVTDVREELPPFNAIELNDDLDIDLQKSYSPGYTLKADDNLIDVLKFEVEDNTLMITSFYKITSKKKLDITVNYSELQSITMQDGKIKMKDMVVTDELTVNTYGSAKLELNANASVMHINMEGNSSGDLNLDSDSLNITLKDRIDVKIYAVSEKNTTKVLKDAQARMEGTTDTLWLTMVGNTDLKAQKLEAATVIATLEESAMARVNAYESLELSARGSSKTYSHGPGKITLLDFLDKSELYKRED